MNYAFISYSSINKASADAMRELLKKHNINVWMAPYDIPAGVKYASAITKAIRECSCFVLLLTNSAQDSDAVDTEVEMAKYKYKKNIIAVELENVELNDSFVYYLNNTHYVSAHKIDDDSYEIKQVMDAIKAFTAKSEDDKDDSNDFPYGTVDYNPIDLSDKIKRIDRYEMQFSLGKGGFGHVFAAKDMINPDNDLVAVKVSDAKCDYILRMHKYLVGRTNEHLCKIYDAGTVSGGVSYVAMELINGATPLSEVKSYREFYERLDDNYPVGSHFCVMLDVLKGLRCLHNLGIVHDDINPSNILTDGFVTKLIDYDGAFFIKDKENKDGVNTVLMLGYESPEEIGERDFRSDLYSVGMVAYTWFTGLPPQRDARGDLKYDFEKGLGFGVYEILKKATALNPDDRYQTADEFINDLKASYDRYVIKNGNLSFADFVSLINMQNEVTTHKGNEKSPDQYDDDVKNAAEDMVAEFTDNEVMLSNSAGRDLANKLGKYSDRLVVPDEYTWISSYALQDIYVEKIYIPKTVRIIEEDSLLNLSYKTKEIYLHKQNAAYSIDKVDGRYRIVGNGEIIPVKKGVMLKYYE